MEDSQKSSNIPKPNNSLTNVSTETENNDFVTIVQVDNNAPEKQDYVTRVTVLSEKNNVKNSDEKIGVTNNHSHINEEVVIYRLPGERLGMGLKFIGGENVSECITSLFIQSITPDSPASRTRCQWGCLEEGDEILQIEKQDVTFLTRLDCVSILKNAPVALCILVQHKLGSESINQCSDHSENVNEINLLSDDKSQPGKKNEKINQDQLFVSSEISENSTKEMTDNNTQKHQILSSPSSRITKTEVFNMSSQKVKVTSIEGKNLPITNKTDNYVKDVHNLRSICELPVVADIYTDLIAEEDKKLYEYESDDTGSSVSTVIDIISVPGSSINYGLNKCSSCNENGCLDFAQALLPFEQLENEFNTDFTKSITKNSYEMTNFDETSNQEILKEANKQLLNSANKISSINLKREAKHESNNEFLLSTLEGHVSQERRKFEILIEQATPKQIKNSQKCNKQMSTSQSKKKAEQFEATLLSFTNYTAKKENVPPPIPPRQNKKNKNATNVNETLSNVPVTQSRSSSNQVQQQVNRIKDEQKTIQTACNNFNNQEEDCLSSNLTVTDNSERLLAVEFWLEESIKSFGLSEETDTQMKISKSIVDNPKQLTQQSNSDQLLGGETGSTSASTPILDSGAVANSLDVSNTLRNEMENCPTSNSRIKMEQKIQKENEKSENTVSNFKVISDLPSKSETDFSPTISRLPPDGHEFPPSFDESLKAKQFDPENDDNQMPSKYITYGEINAVGCDDKVVPSGALAFNTLAEIKNNQAEEIVSDVSNNSDAKEVKISLSTQSHLKQWENNLEKKLDKENFKDGTEIKESETLHSIITGTINESTDSKELSSSDHFQSEQENDSAQKMNTSLDSIQHTDASYISNDMANNELDLTITENSIFDSLLHESNSSNASNLSQNQSKELPNVQENKKDQVEEGFQQSISKKKFISMDQSEIIKEKTGLKISANSEQDISSELNKLCNKKYSQHEDSSQDNSESFSKNVNELKKVDIKQISNNNHDYISMDFTKLSKDVKKLVPHKKSENSFCTLPDKMSPRDSSPSLYCLLESRRQQVSKLKGLIIPEKSEAQFTAEKILPIPLIKSSKTNIIRGKSNLPTDKYSSLPRGIGLAYHCSQNDVKSRPDKVNKSKSTNNNEDSCSNKCMDVRSVQVDTNLNQQLNNRPVNKFEETNFKLSEKENITSSQSANKFHFEESQSQITNAKLDDTDGRKFPNPHQEVLNFKKEPKFSEISTLTNYKVSLSNQSKQTVSKNVIPELYSWSKLHNDVAINSSQIQTKSNYHGNINQLQNFLKNETMQNNQVNEFVRNNTGNHKINTNTLHFQQDNICINPVSKNNNNYESNVANAKTLTSNKDITNYSKNSFNNDANVTSAVTYKQKWEEIQEKYKHHSKNICFNDTMSEKSPPLRKQYAEESNEITLNPHFKPKHLSRQITVLNTNHVSGESVKSFKALAEQWEQRSQDAKSTEKYVPQNKYSNQVSTFSTMIHKTNDNKAFTPRDDKLNQYQRAKGLTAYSAIETPIWSKNKRHSIEIVERIPFQFENNGQKEGNEFNIMSMFQKTASPNKNMPMKETFTDIKTKDNLKHSLEVQKIKDSLSSKLKNSGTTSTTTQTSLKHKSFFNSLDSEKSSINFNSPQHSNYSTFLSSEVNQHTITENQSHHHDIITVVLHRDTPDRPTGISIKGGNDFESKEIIVNKIIRDSLADRNGQIKEGDSIISINGKNTIDLSYSEVLNVLNAPHIECTLVLKRKGIGSKRHLEDSSNGKIVHNIKHNPDTCNEIITNQRNFIPTTGNKIIATGIEENQSFQWRS